MREQFRDDPEATEDLAAILKAADRAALLTRHLLAFSRQQVMRVEVCVLAEVVERSVRLLERVLEDNIDIRTRIDPGNWPVQVDAIQLEQVILNMAVNAAAWTIRGTVRRASADLRPSPWPERAAPSVPRQRQPDTPPTVVVIADCRP